MYVKLKVSHFILKIFSR